MSLGKKDLQTLMITVARSNPSSQVAYSIGKNKFNFDYKDLNKTLRKELNEYASTNQLYRENKNLIFTLIENTIDDVLPQKVMQQYGSFAEIKNMKNGERAIFTQRISAAAKRRAMQFITKVGLAGIYEVFKLDGQSFEIQTSAYGGAAQIGFEEFLDGRVDFADVLDIVMEGLDRAIFIEIERALRSSIDSLPIANKSVQSSFSETEMDRLISIADSYGNKASVYCTYEFAATMLPATGWMSDSMLEEKWNNGYLGNYKGHKVIVLQQSYEDETNSKKVIDPSYAWIMPTGSSKPVKIAIEGNTIVKEWENKDLSKEIQVYKKLGAGIMVTNNLCVYQNTSLTI